MVFYTILIFTAQNNGFISIKTLENWNTNKIVIKKNFNLTNRNKNKVAALKPKL